MQLAIVLHRIRDELADLEPLLVLHGVQHIGWDVCQTAIDESINLLVGEPGLQSPAFLAGFD